jgi:hypothetical protein
MGGTTPWDRGHVSPPLARQVAVEQYLLELSYSAGAHDPADRRKDPRRPGSDARQKKTGPGAAGEALLRAWACGWLPRVALAYIYIYTHYQP